MSSSILELSFIAKLMEWTEDEQTQEFAWLRLMSRFKYDAYSDFIAGARFTGTLIQWLRQFSSLADRRAAYSFIRKQLVFVSAAEMRRLVEAFYPSVMERRLVDSVAAETGRKAFEVMLNLSSSSQFERIRQSTLIVGMSEGAQLDPLRRANMGILSHERMLPSVEMDADKWKDVLKTMRKELKDDRAGFAAIFLIDDFVASGTTFLRKEKDGTWKGKFRKFLSRLPQESDDWKIEDTAKICVHHYIGSEKGVATLLSLKTDAELLIKEILGKGLPIEFTFGWHLPKDAVVDDGDANLHRLVNTYYSTDIESHHNTAGRGTSEDIRWGYKDCRLSVVLEHNTPNNSLPLIWAHAEGIVGHAMRPLFRRRQRHG